jgi:hypothetical protein
MGRGWSGLLLRLGAMAAIVIGFGVWMANENRERRELLKKVPVLTLQIRTQGWDDDPLFGRQYTVFYAGTQGQPELDCREIAELYAAVGCKPKFSESVNSGCRLTFEQQPGRTITNVRIDKLKAQVTVAGPAQPPDGGRMTEALLNMAWDRGVKAKAVSDIKQTTSPLLWEGEFVFQFGD